MTLEMIFISSGSVVYQLHRKKPFQVFLGNAMLKLPVLFLAQRNPHAMNAIFLTSTSLALGEAYMDGDLEIEGDLYYALDHFLGQMDRFSADESALKKLMFPSTAKKNQHILFPNICRCAVVGFI